MNYLLAFFLPFMISLVSTPLIRQLAYRIGAIDKPDKKRKFHDQPIPRIGGVGITFAFVITFLLHFDLTRPFVGLLVGLLILFITGLVDDIKSMRARWKLFWQVIAAVAILSGGVGIVSVTNPLGGVIHLDFWRIPVEMGAIQFNILPWANLVSILWIVGLINVINFLDGLDGLATGISSIACLVLFVTALSPAAANLAVSLLSIILLGALLGFLPYNFNPARIFLGDSGAYVIGMLLALFSIYGESKVAVGSLVLGFAILDSVLVVTRRLLKKQSPFKPDRNHLHHFLYDSGLFSHRQTVLILYTMTVVLAVAVLFTSGVMAFAVMISLLVGIVMFVKLMSARRRA